MRHTPIGEDNLIHSVYWFTCQSHPETLWKINKVSANSQTFGPRHSMAQVSWYIKLTITGNSHFISIICPDWENKFILCFIDSSNIHELVLCAEVYVFLYSTYNSASQRKPLLLSFIILAEERIIYLFLWKKRWKNMISGRLCVLLSRVFQPFGLTNKWFILSQILRLAFLGPRPRWKPYSARYFCLKSHLITYKHRHVPKGREWELKSPIMSNHLRALPQPWPCLGKHMFPEAV